MQLTIRSLVLTLTALLAITPLSQQLPAIDTVKTTAIPVVTKKVFQNIEIDRPIVLTHAGDGSNRIFIASQLGKIHVLPNDRSAETTEVFLDIEDRVVYKDKQNEEGLLGLAFHPNFKNNGQFFVYYSTKAEPQLSIISRFNVSDGDTGKADPDSEHEIMRIKQPFWNHNGGTLCFGPDGMLYIALGDGGAANDPQGNGQNLSTLLGSILRIDVDHQNDGKAYAIPKDNPFVDHADARPEIFAYGLRNVWRMSFDRKSGLLYAADVGQDIWEEVDIIKSGGNYGWNKREGKHDFMTYKGGPDDQYIEPIWEYDHDTGKSITGGHVYRGSDVDSLRGVYLFADYVTGYVWGIRYDESTGRVTEHHEIAGPHFDRARKNYAPVITFGEDERGEVYFTDARGNIFAFAGKE